MTSVRGPGRPRRSESASHREAVAEAARQELTEQGYAAATMAGVARRARASKETLYRWYGDKAGLMASLVEEEGRATLVGLTHALEDDDRPVGDVLAMFGARLLTLLTGAWSLTANRAAIASPELAATVLAKGRHAVGPVVEDYLRRQHERGAISAPDPATAFTLLYGLVVRDTQIRVLLGEPAPDAEVLTEQARTGVEAFLSLHQPRRD